MRKGNRKNTIIAISVVALLLTMILVVSALFVTKIQENELLDSQLSASEMELYIRRFSSEKRAEAEESKASEYEHEMEMRKQLREQMMENDREDFLTLVNPWNEVPEDYEVRTVKIGRRGEDEDMYLDERAAAALCEMIKDCEAAGCRPVPISAYRTNEYQQKLFDDKVLRVMEEGTPASLAPEIAGQSVAKPGTSEHELGLAVDIIDDSHQDLDYWQEWTKTQQWLIQHCTEYGFILRYPSNTEDVTGIIFEPWHYRYVGKTLAREYTESSAKTFEEFLTGR